ncbi:type 2 lantipeptide synthetase LanM [Listeria sp. FSL L7-1582]|uniref:type 2 lanthipeptide synthetase LanM n=1 Tax=Listeria portnoyi TaxID=2713504 RepID=UPI00164D21D2|nr:type 2 lanthipeptide synthetase LanM [Listeria portnoyi]MBC6308474.1 type 2 lantipeptide synthetase LanM [Listeria portnoyi]
MFIYSKNLYPELEKSDFEEHIMPLSEDLSKLSIDDEIPKILFSKILMQEEYPYQNICMNISQGKFNHFWDNDIDKQFLDPDLFKKTICEIFSQIVFSYLIRSFAEDIKSFNKMNLPKDEVYSSYIDYLQKDDMREFSSKYKVGWVRIHNVLKNRILALMKSVNLIKKYRYDIHKKFHISQSSKIKMIESGGDTHNKGYSVFIITFENNEKIIFKPRSVSGELNYSRFIKKINEFISPQMPHLDVLDYDNCGFTNFGESINAKNDMYSAGMMACLMYLLDASDMHYSNILWTVEGPLPVDLETLFQPSRIRMGIDESENSAYTAIEKSVYGTGVLPISIGKKSVKQTVDVGFTGIRDEFSVSPFKNFTVINGFSPDIKIVWEVQPVDRSLSNDKQLEKKIFKDSDKIIRGFSFLYLKILDNKELFRRTVLDIFENTQIRYLHNMTYRYEQSLRVLTDAYPSKNLSIAQALLSRNGILSMTSDNSIVISECKQLWDGDIPYFTVKFNEADVYHNHEIISRLRRSPKSQFLSKVNNLSGEDLDRQIKLIRLAFVAKLSDPHADGKADYYEEYSDDIREKKNMYLDASRTQSITKVLDYFTKNLVCTVLDDRYKHLPKTWLGPVARFEGEGWTPGVLGYDLYSGRTGIALALLASSKVLSNDEAYNIGFDIFDKSADILEGKSFELRNLMMSGIGAYTGVTGFLWSLFKAGCLIENMRWKRTAIASMKLLDSYLEDIDSNYFDMISGKSGAIIMKLEMDQNYYLDEIFLQKLIENAYMKINSNDENLTSGLAHGLGQVILFFAKVQQRQPNDSVKKIISDTVSIMKEKYTDSNNVINIYCGLENQISSTWCNGLSGILLAYYEAYKANCISKVEVEKIIKQLRGTPISKIPILCHGSLGIIEVLNYIKIDFEEVVIAMIKELEETFCSPEYIYQYFENSKGRYPLSPGIMSGQAGGILYLSGILNSNLNISPVVIGK